MATLKISILFRLCCLLSISFPIATAVPTDAAQEYAKGPGPYKVDAVFYEWVDVQRSREVPVKIYYPQPPNRWSKENQGLLPIIIFSHGLGGSREGYEYLGKHWAGYGYVSVHVQHRGSDEQVWKNKGKPVRRLGRAMIDPKNSINRVQDISFAIDQMKLLNDEESPFKGRLNLDRIGVAGHSFGAFTSLAIAGQVFSGMEDQKFSFVDPRVKAVIAMSSPVPKNRDSFDTAFGQIRIPCLHMTGTKDDSPMGTTTAEDRRIPFDYINGADQYLVIFRDVNHMVFAGWDGTEERRPGEQSLVVLDLIRMSSTAFWDAYLKKNADAKNWLAGDGFKTALANEGTFEEKLRTGF